MNKNFIDLVVACKKKTQICMHSSQHFFSMNILYLYKPFKTLMAIHCWHLLQAVQMTNSSLKGLRIPDLKSTVHKSFRQCSYFSHERPNYICHCFSCARVSTLQETRILGNDDHFIHLQTRITVR